MEVGLGLVLGAGGARGGVHIGLLKVLDEEGIRIGPIAGASAGGLVGGLYAAGLPGAEIEELLLGLDAPSLLERDRSGWSLASTHAFIDLLRRRLGDVQIEDLIHPFCAVAVDLLTGAEVHLRQGPLCSAIQATIAVPVLLCPLEQDGRVLVDGGLLNKVPVDAVRPMGPGRVLAVDPDTPPDTTMETGNLGPLPGLMPRLLRGVLRLTKRERTAMAIARTTTIPIAELTARRLREYPPDLLLQPDLSTVPAMDLSRLPEAIAIGERLAREHLAEIRALERAPQES